MIRRNRPPRRSLRSLLASLILLLGAAPATASFPAIGEAQRALTEVPGSPAAPAVMLESRAELWLGDARDERLASRLEVWQRIKVLSSEGVGRYGEIDIHHSRWARLSGFEGRTVLPDGREVPVGEDAVFRRRSSKNEKRFVTAAAFPVVEVGAILDYRYTVHVDDIFYLEPWYFQSEIPTLHAEVLFHVPETLEVAAWSSELPGRELQREILKDKGGHRLRVWLTDLPALPDEPFGPPVQDLSAWFMLIPTEMNWPGGTAPLLGSWREVCNLIGESMYRPALNSRRAKEKGRELAASTEGGPRAVAEALYRHVRDQIRTDPGDGVLLSADTKIDRVLAEGHGRSAEKALLLHALLEGAKIESELVWVPDRWDGKVDPKVPNPAWFEKMIVRIQLPTDDGEELVYLDPADRRLGFGFMDYHNEDVPALVFDPKAPEVVALPLTPASWSRRRATLELALDPEGRVAGTGELELTGHHATRWLGVGEGDKSATEVWQEWLAERWEGYDIGEVEVAEVVESRWVQVTWSMSQREEAVLGDEASLLPSRPLGPARPFHLDPERRRSPVLLRFPAIDEVRLRLSWPSGWEVEALPGALDRRTAAGVVAAGARLEEGARSLTYERRFEVRYREFANAAQYGALQPLYEALETHDAQALVLVAR